MSANRGFRVVAAVLFGISPLAPLACAAGNTDGGEGGSTTTEPDSCPAPFLTCGGDCVDPDTDEAHCGACDNACAPGVVCSDGECALTCGADEVICNAQCIDPSSDDAHCGATADCQGANAGDACPDGESCVDGTCALVCPMGELVCDDSCVDPSTDPIHCGAIGDCLGAASGVTCGGPPTTCPGALDEICDLGECAAACAPGSEMFTFTGMAETFTMPACASEITVKAWGAQGGSSTSGSLGGLGAYVEGVLCLAGGTSLTVIVGEQPPSAPYPNGGGGGSFVADGMVPLFIAGGGGGGYFDWTAGGASTLLASMGVGVGGTSNNDGGGGGGFAMDGAGTAGSGGLSFLNGAGFGIEFPMGNTNCSRGGFGGGGGASQSGTYNAGGGGGYDGGNAGNGNASTGGSSFISATATSTLHTPASQMGHGQIEISWR